MTTPAAAVSTTQDTPDRTHPSYDAMAPVWSRIRDLLGGTDAVKAAGQKYLPKHEAETLPDYEVRRKLGVLFNAFKRTLGAMVGLVTARDVQLGDDNSELIVEHWENIDGRGTHGAVFARRLFREALAMGHAGILVDAPPVEQEGRALSKADERALGIRPYWRRYSAEDIRDWDFQLVNGQTVLRLLVLRETFFERKGRFGAQQVTEYRVFEWFGPGNITVERWREERGPGGTKVTQQGATRSIVGPMFIPFAPLVTGDSGDEDALTSQPPLIDLADLNLTHYRSDTERRNLLRLGCLPVPVRIGYQSGQDEPKQAIGPNVMLDVPVGGDFKWAEVSGGAYQPTADDLKEMVRHMAALGLAFLESDTRAAETAEAKRLDTTSQNASLASSARGLQDAIEAALGFHAEYLKAEGGSATVNTDFERTVLDPAMIGALNSLKVAGSLSLETLLNMLHRGRVLGDDFNVEEEVARIMAEGAGTPDDDDDANDDPDDKDDENDNQ